MDNNSIEENISSMEFFDVLDSHGNPNGLRKTKDEILDSGDWRLVTHAWIVNGSGELLAQKRANNKGLWDNLWDVTVGGGVTSGEVPVQACVRELNEELGLYISPEELTPIGRYETTKLLPERGITAYEFSETFISKKEIERESLKLQETEVSDTAWVPLDIVGRDTKSMIWIPHPSAYYKAIAQKCREML